VTVEPKDLLVVGDGGLPAREVGPWTVTKYQLLRYYDHMFATGMKGKWDYRVYIDLFAGPGHSIIKRSNLRVAGSPVIAMKVKDPFDQYIFCEEGASSLRALKVRADALGFAPRTHCIEGNCNEKVDDIFSRLPPPSTTFNVLTFCFVDPTNLDIHFATIRKLAQYRMDFLVLLAAVVHGGRNWKQLIAPDDQTLDNLFGSTDWRSRLGEARGRIEKFRLFLAHEYASQMEWQLGYGKVPLEKRLKAVRSTDKNLSLYYLLFFSKSERAYYYWDQALRYSEQPTLFDASAAGG
jgi:three-Cys-motif partner protein